VGGEKSRYGGGQIRDSGWHSWGAKQALTRTEKKKLKEEEKKKIKLIRQKRRVDSWVPGAGLECCLFCAGMDGAGRTGTKPGTRQVKGALSWWIKIWQSGRKASAWGGAR
jgi:hypothetical protein